MEQIFYILLLVKIVAKIYLLSLVFEYILYLIFYYSLFSPLCLSPTVLFFCLRSFLAVFAGEFPVNEK